MNVLDNRFGQPHYGFGHAAPYHAAGDGLSHWTTFIEVVLRSIGQRFDVR